MMPYCDHLKFHPHPSSNPPPSSHTLHTPSTLPRLPGSNEDCKQATRSPKVSPPPLPPHPTPSLTPLNPTHPSPLTTHPTPSLIPLNPPHPSPRLPGSHEDCKQATRSP